MLLRVVLTLLLVLVGLEIGIRFAPRHQAPATRHQSLATSLQPDWGGGRLLFDVRGHAPGDTIPNRSDSGHVPSRFGSCPRDSSDKSDIPVVIRKKPGRDYALALALPVSGQPGRTGLFELPSSSHFKKQVLPGAGDAEAPAADIPLYPKSDCRMQVGPGTACFTGFYLTPDSIEAVRSFYVRALSRLGWQRVTADRAGLLETFAKPNQDRTVVVQLRKQDSVTTRIGLVAMTSGSPARDERK